MRERDKARQAEAKALEELKVWEKEKRIAEQRLDETKKAKDEADQAADLRVPRA